MFTPCPKPSKVIKEKKRHKNTPRKILENKLDTLASKVCRQLGHCIFCPPNGNKLNAHHFFSRKYKHLRWYLPNLICLDVHHHTFSFTFSAHKTPEAFKKRMIEIKGQDWFDDLERRKSLTTDITMTDLLRIKEELEILQTHSVK